MIEKMRKYTFVLYHQDYQKFLADLQKLGVVHLVQNTEERTETLIQNMQQLEEYAEQLRFLKKLGSTSEKTSISYPSQVLLQKIQQAREEKEKLERLAETLRKQIRELAPWGHFDYDLVKKLQQSGIKVAFYTCLKNHFKPQWSEEYAVQIINEVNGILYFVVLYTDEKPDIEAEPFSFHQHTLMELESQLKNIENQIKDIDEYLYNIAPTAIEIFSNKIEDLSKTCEYEEAVLQGIDEAEGKIKILQGFIPQRLEKELVQFLESENVIYFAADATVEDNPPVSLTNNWFARLFEPISKMYMLPYYNEFDLTPFFAPFFMLFFGFCNADIVYGIVFILLSLLIYRKVKNPAIKSIGLLGVIFGTSSMIMGFLMGSALGFDLKNTALDPYILIRDNSQIFNLSLLLGAIQILFGTIINGVKQAKQSGIKYFLAPLGTFLFLLSLTVLGAGLLGVDNSSITPYTKYLLWIGLALMLLFNNPAKNPLVNILSGLWLLYNVVTGFFGDILSYIRLFALGVSSAILGMVINSIGLQFLNIKFVGPIIFFIFMVAGHTLNIALGALSGFVHPLRLTFVEFYKNAGFQGPGIPYQPFGHKKMIKI
jgi:V/A-type H+-transporting ATPase subunit I